MPSFISRVLRFVFRLVLWLFAAIFTLSLLLAALVLLVLGRLKAWITGQKPKPMVFGRFQRFTPQTMWPDAATRGSAAPREAQVVDVEVREIRSDKHLP